MGLFLGKDFRANMNWSNVCGNLWGSNNCSSLWSISCEIRVCKSCKKSQTEEQLRTVQLLMDLIGDSQLMPMWRVHSQGGRYTSRNEDKEEKVELKPL